MTVGNVTKWMNKWPVSSISMKHHELSTCKNGLKWQIFFIYFFQTLHLFSLFFVPSFYSSLYDPSQSVFLSVSPHLHSEQSVSQHTTHTGQSVAMVMVQAEGKIDSFLEAQMLLEFKWPAVAGKAACVCGVCVFFGAQISCRHTRSQSNSTKNLTRPLTTIPWSHSSNLRMGPKKDGALIDRTCTKHLTFL